MADVGKKCDSGGNRSGDEGFERRMAVRELLPLMDKDMAGSVKDRPFLFSPDGERCLAEIAENAEMVRLTANLGHTENTESFAGAKGGANVNLQ